MDNASVGKSRTTRSLLLHVMAGANYASRPAEFSAICARVTPFSPTFPLVHLHDQRIVVQTFTANTLLALGASPAMVIETEEASQFAAIASALLINVGTLTRPRAQAMSAAIEQATRSQTPWTLDSGCGWCARLSPPFLSGTSVP